MPLQSPAVRAALALPIEDALIEMRVITRDGPHFRRSRRADLSVRFCVQAYFRIGEDTGSEAVVMSDLPVCGA